MLLWILLTVVLVAAIALASLRWVSSNLATTEATAVYDVDVATEWAADQLPTALQNRLSHADVELMLLSHLGWMRGNGLATFGEVDLEAQNAAVGGDDVVGHEDAAVDAVLADMSARGREIDALDVVAVVELSNRYLGSIGALGPSTPLG